MRCLHYQFVFVALLSEMDDNSMRYRDGTNDYVGGTDGEIENGNSNYDFEDMEFLDEEEDANAGSSTNDHSAGGMEESEHEAAVFDFYIEAHEREFRAQKKDRPLDILHVEANDKDQFERQLWDAYSSVLKREILYQRAEEGCEERVEWSPVTKPAWEDRDRFFLLQLKRNIVRLSDLSDDLLESLKGLTVKMSVLVYSDSLVSAKDYNRAKEVLALGKRAGCLKDRSGADANQGLMKLVSKLKSQHKDRFVKPLDASFVLWANHIQCSPAHLRDDLINESPPDHLKNLFIQVDETSMEAVLSESIEDTTIAETISDNYEVEIAEIEAAFEKVELSVAELRTSIDRFKACRRNNKALISAFKRSLKVTEGEESRKYAEKVVDCPDIDHM